MAGSRLVMHGPGMGSFSLFSDPEGRVMGLWKVEDGSRVTNTGSSHPKGDSVGGNKSVAYNNPMEISFAPELEAKLNRIASQTGKGASQVVQELVANYLEHDEWFRKEVKKGLASLDSGKSVSHEEVRRQMDRQLNS